MKITQVRRVLEELEEEHGPDLDLSEIRFIYYLDTKQEKMEVKFVLKRDYEVETE